MPYHHQESLQVFTHCVCIELPSSICFHGEHYLVLKIWSDSPEGTREAPLVPQDPTFSFLPSLKNKFQFIPHLLIPVWAPEGTKCGDEPLFPTGRKSKNCRNATRNCFHCKSLAEKYCFFRGGHTSTLLALDILLQEPEKEARTVSSYRYFLKTSKRWQ